MSFQKLLVAQQVAEIDRLRRENLFFHRLIDKMKAAAATRKRSR